MKHLLEISKSEFNFSLLQRDDTLIEAQIIIPFAHEELSKTIISLSQKILAAADRRLSLFFQREQTTKMLKSMRFFKIIEFSQTTDFIYIFGETRLYYGH
jgi:hypothetical protein